MTKPEIPDVAVVLLNWNGRHFLEKFLPSILSSTWPGLRIIVADNDSKDDSIRFLAERYPTVERIALEKNHGFAGGYNEALKQIDADYYVLLNSDVEVSPGWIEPVIAMLEQDPGIAAAQPKIRSWNRKDYLEYAGAAGGFIDRLGYPFCRGRIFDVVEPDTGQYDTDRPIFWASGAALFVRSSAWKASGGFDARFFAHMEEIDLCWRLLNMGYEIRCCHASVVWHVGGGTLTAGNPYKTYLNFRNSLYMLKKNLPPAKAGRVIFCRFWLDFISLAVFVLKGQFAHAASISRAHRDFLRHSRQFNSTAESPSSPGERIIYRGSIVWDFFVNKKRTFSELRF